MINTLIDMGRKIIPIGQFFLTEYVIALEKEYATLLDYIEQEAKSGDIFELEKYVTKHINGGFTSTLRGFVRQYDKNKKKNIN